MNDLDVYAEAGVLANILDDPSSLIDVLEIINAEDFLEPRHAQVFEAFVSMHDRGEKIRVTTVANELRNVGLLEKIGGTSFLTSLIDPSAPYCADGDAVIFADIVQDESKRRQLANAAKDVIRMSASNSGVLADETVHYMRDIIQNLQMRSAEKKEAQGVSSLIQDALVSLQERSENDGVIQGIPSGFIDLDDKTTGWHPGQFIVIAARPAVGKSTLALDFIRAASCAHKYTSMFFSLEMSREEIMQRLIAAEGGVSLNAIRDGKLSGEDWEKVTRVASELEGKNIILDDSAAMNVDHIRSAAIRQSTQPEGLDMIVVDYLQLMSSGRKVESRQQEVSEFSRSLKLLARELGVPVIALSQLNRGPENASRPPRMSDIRESGAIEQDADIIMLLHRESNDGGVTDQTVLILEKNRQGESQIKVPLLARLDIAQFVSGVGKYRASEEVIFASEMENIPPDDTGALDSATTFREPVDNDSSITEDAAPVWGAPPEPQSTEELPDNSEPQSIDISEPMFPSNTHTPDDTDTIETDIDSDEGSDDTTNETKSIAGAW